MARRSRAREEALAQARAAQRRATNKISRNRQQGTYIGGTEYDPRVNPQRMAEMGTRELQRLVKQLNAFNSRETQFTGLFGGKPIPRAQWEEYKRLEQAQNAQAVRLENAVRNIKLPGQDQTIGQYIGATTAQNQAAANQQTRIFHTINRKPNTIVDAKGLQTLIEQMRQKNSPGYVKQAVEKRMNSIYALLEGSGLQDRIKEVKRLSVAEKQALLDYSNFAELARERFGSGDDEIEDQSKIDQDWIERGEDRAEYINREMNTTLAWIRETVANELASAGNNAGSRSRRAARSRRGR